MTDIDALLNKNNPKYIAQTVAENSKKRRIQLNLTQKELAERSGVSLSTLKRFEQKAEISFANLVKIAIVTDAAEDLLNIFKKNKITSIDDYIKKTKIRQRVRKPKK